MAKRTTIIIAASLFLVSVAVGVAALIIMPQMKDWRAIQDRIAQVDAAVKEREDLLRAAEALEANFSEALKKQERLKTLLPSQEDPAGLLSMLSSIAAAHGMILQKVAFLSDEKTNPVPSALDMPTESFHVFPLSVSMSGNYPALRSFLGALSKSLRLIDVRSMTLAPQGSGSDLITMEAEFVTYYKGK